MKFKRSVGLWFFLLLMVSSAYSQPAGCDEGVIRLPDRTGTIQICSALAARVPELAKQLSQATALIGSQQAQLSELTRLVRGLNNVSRGIGLQRQRVSGVGTDRLTGPNTPRVCVRVLSVSVMMARPANGPGSSPNTRRKSACTSRRWCTQRRRFWLPCSTTR